MGSRQPTRYYIYRIAMPNGGEGDCLSLLPSDHVFEHGMAPAAILGYLKEPAEPGVPITPEMLLVNDDFVRFLHDVVARFAPEMEGLKAEAARQGSGYVYVIDGRTASPTGDIPARDIIGAFAVQCGTLDPRSYRPNPNYQVLSIDGLLQLGAGLQEDLMRELMRLEHHAGPTQDAP